MELRLRITRTRVAVAAAAVALAAAGVALGVARNDYTDAQGVYHACVNTTNGNLRVVAPGASCRRHEDAIDWNRIGPRGLRGLQGEPGEIGPRGPRGPQGPQGETGQRGPEGERGATGPQGPQGATGAAGPQGATGAAGPAGPQGATGATGPQGPTGATGATGAQGPKGDNGAQGPAGPMGPPGPAGDLVEEEPEPYTTQLGLSLEVVGEGSVAIRSIAGCRIEQIGGTQALEQCYFTVVAKSTILWDWLEDSLQGNNVLRSLEIRESGSQGTVAQVGVKAAFLTEFRIDGVDGDSTDPATVTFVVQPGQLLTGSLTSPGPMTPATAFAQNRFRFEIGTFDMTRTMEVGPLSVVWPVVTTASGKTPGAPSVVPFEVVVNGSSNFTSTAQALQGWVADALQGDPNVAKNGSLELLAGDMQTVLAEFELNGMQPASGLDPLGTRRTILVSAAALDAD